MSDKQPIGERLHLLRLALGWSTAECAYRLTLESNELILPQLWETWEKSRDRDATMQDFSRYADTISRMFGLAPESLMHGSWDHQSAAELIALPDRLDPRNKQC